MSTANGVSVLPHSVLTANRTHRFYTDETNQTDRVIDHLRASQHPLFAVEVLYSKSFYEDFHSHDHGQITYVLYGMMTFITEDRSFVVPARFDSVYFVFGQPDHIACGHHK